MLVGSNDGGVDEDLAKASFSAKRRKHPMPHTGARPARKALVRAVPRAELKRQVTPRTAGAGNPQHRLDELAVVRPAAPRVANLARQQTLDPLPLVISKLLSHRASNPSNGLERHYRFECQQTLANEEDCQRSSAFAYDRDIATEIQAAMAASAQFSDTSLWVTVQGRIVYVEGCVAKETQGAGVEHLVRRLPHVQQAIAIVMVSAEAKPPYKLFAAK